MVTKSEIQIIEYVQREKAQFKANQNLTGQWLDNETAYFLSLIDRVEIATCKDTINFFVMENITDYSILGYERNKLKSLEKFELEKLEKLNA